MTGPFSRASLLLIAAGALSGCLHTAQEKAHTTAVGKGELDLVSYTGTTRGAYVWRKDGNRVCAEPPPDLGLTTARELAASLAASAESFAGVQGPKAEAAAMGKLNTAVVELAGRSQIVLLAREFLYRQCELAANFAGKPDLYKALAENNEKILNVVVTLAQTERDQARADFAAINKEAGERIAAQESDIEKILAHVAKADGALDPKALKALTEKAEIDPSFRTSIQARTDLESLRQYLQLSPESVTQALAKAIQ